MQEIERLLLIPDWVLQIHNRLTANASKKRVYVDIYTNLKIALDPTDCPN
jgi:hypothetical protein